MGRAHTHTNTHTRQVHGGIQRNTPNTLSLSLRRHPDTHTETHTHTHTHTHTARRRQQQAGRLQPASLPQPQHTATAPTHAKMPHPQRAPPATRRRPAECPTSRSRCATTRLRSCTVSGCRPSTDRPTSAQQRAQVASRRLFCSWIRACYRALVTVSYLQG